MPFTCASPLRSVWIGAGVGGKVSHLSAASAGRTARTRVGASRNGRMSFSLWASKYLLAFRLQTSLASRCLQTPFPSLALSRHYFFAKVRFAPTDYRAKRRERRKIMTLAVDEFIRRFLIHVLPNGFHRIRHCGLSPKARAPITSQVRVSCSPLQNLKASPPLRLSIPASRS